MAWHKGTNRRPMTLKSTHSLHRVLPTHDVESGIPPDQPVGSSNAWEGAIFEKRPLPSAGEQITAAPVPLIPASESPASSQERAVAWERPKTSDNKIHPFNDPVFDR